MINLPHPGRVSSGEIIIDSDQMDTPAHQGIQIHSESRSQGLPLAGFHFRYTTLMKDNSANELNVIMSLSQSSFGRFPDRSEGRGQYLIQIRRLFFMSIEVCNF